MAKWANDLVMDAALDYIATCTRLCVCSEQPTTYAEATTTYDGGASKYKLAIKTITGADFAKADDSSGRKVTIAQQAGMTVDATAPATHIALCIASGSVLVYVTTCTSQSLTAGNTVTAPAWKVNFGDPT
jgi:hypothetical protein